VRPPQDESVLIHGALRATDVIGVGTMFLKRSEKALTVFQSGLFSFGYHTYYVNRSVLFVAYSY
jgi:hypothetical protein